MEKNQAYQKETEEILERFKEIDPQNWEVLWIIVSYMNPDSGIRRLDEFKKGKSRHLPSPDQILRRINRRVDMSKTKCRYGMPYFIHELRDEVENYLWVYQLLQKAAFSTNPKERWG